MTTVSRSWFDRFETSLEADAAAAGLFAQSSATGAAREFLVRRVLRSFLPRNVHLGSGLVVDSDGKRSAQVDIVVYDGRCPMFEIDDGLGLYPIEGTIATIEIKSTLTETHLKSALDNVHSVIRLSGGLKSYEPMKERMRHLMGSKMMSHADAHRKVGYEILPACYVFAFRSKFRRCQSDSTMVPEVWIPIIMSASMPSPP